jgi:hydrogenase maturation protease
MKKIVIGLGNPILGDDGVGWRVAEEVARQLPPSPSGRGDGDEGDVEVDCVALGGLSMMERLTGYDFVVIIDAFYTGSAPVGTVSQFLLTDLPDLSSGHTTAVHDTSLHNALNIGRGMDIPLPADENVLIVAVEAANIYDFSESLSPEVEAAVPEATEKVLELLKNAQII